MGTSRKSKLRRRRELEKEMPCLKGSGYELTSDPVPRYNCIAWAAGDDSQRWDDSTPDDYWPHEDRTGTIESLMMAFALIDYELCGDGTVEDGFEKVALYATFDEHGAPTAWGHAAKQLSDGRWSSKCGRLDDIAHLKLSDVNCDAYGEFYCFMRRKKEHNGLEYP